MTAPSIPSDLHRFIHGLPKAELHVHIEGTLEPELKFELAQRNGIPLEPATPEEVRASYDYDDLPSFLAVYYESMRVLLTADDFYDLAMAYFRKVAGQGVRYAEVFFDPQAHTSRGVPFQNVIGGLRRALVDARRDLDVHGELIMCFLRDFTAEHAMSTLMEALPYRHWILGVGLDSDEKGHPPVKFAAVFARARTEGFRLTMHCDVDQENTHEHIRQVLEDIAADRIDHGSNAFERPELVERIKERGIGLTCCPISNGWISEGIKEREIVGLLEAGVRVTVNSDDPAYFGGYVGDNYVRLAEAADLSREQLVQLARNSFEVAWLPNRARERYLAELEEYARDARRLSA
ncbi:adenosine deaminase [uncultured Georgenia sp.]|uniref:adenosine deaminase n=1 Tax=uncultured Georgenia sp. TaxID=378209 RepID=UPI0026087B47|nr:adenosine deaminase [uncultured Georgenia sp.]HLV03051.1 adenosine deaminase [Actinomycetaceae bacterium]